MKRLTALLLLLAFPGYAVPWFVDNGSGNDANAGTAIGTAWKHCPGDAAATGVAAAATIGANDTIYFKGGVVYAAANLNNIIVQPPTYSAAGVTFKSGELNSWGSGKAIIDGNGVGGWGFQVFHMSNVIIQDFECRNTIANGQDAAVAFHTTTNCWLRDSIIHDIGTNNTGVPGPHVDGFGCDGQGANVCGGNVVSNCTIHDVTQKAIETGTLCNNNMFVSNIIYNCSDHGITISSGTNTVVGNIISNCSAVVWSEQVQDPSYGIKLSSATGPNNGTHANLIYNNIVAHCIGGIVMENIGGVNLYTNKFFNNTLIDIDSSDNTFRAAFRFRKSSTGTINGTLVRNNLFCSQAVNDTFSPCSVFVYCDDGGTGVLGTNNVIDHNLYFSTAGNNTKALIWQATGPTVVVSWANFADTGSTSPDNRFKQASLGTGNSFDSTSQFFDTDPKFSNYPIDLHLSPSSPAATAGVNLSAYFTTDFYGTTRVNWSIGAVDHLPAPPTAQGATISIGAGVNLGNGVKSL